MRNHLFTKLVGAAVITSLLSACGGGDTTAPAGSPGADPAAQAPAAPSPAAPASPSPAGGAGQETFDDPTVAGGKQPVPQAVSNLIASTNPEERVARVKTGRTDPFGTIPVTRITTRPTLPPRLVPPTVLPPPPLRPAPPPQASPGPVLPPLPEPDLARAVEVTGVVKVGNVPQAIIKAPNESTPRYVREGQRIANGRVLVKRIEIGPIGDPIVILQEQGVDVPKTVSPPAENTNFNQPTLVSDAGQ